MTVSWLTARIKTGAEDSTVPTETASAGTGALLTGSAQGQHAADRSPAGNDTAGMAGKQAETGKQGTFKRLGEILVDDGIITAAQLQRALTVQKEKNGFLGQILVDLGFVTQDVVVSTLVRQCKIPHLSLRDYEIGKDVLQVIPQDLCLKLRILPVDKLGRILTIAMVDPLDMGALEELRGEFPDLRIKPILCDWDHFKSVAARAFGLTTDEGSQEAADEDKSESKAGKEQAAQGEDEGVQAALDAAVEQVIKNAHLDVDEVPEPAVSEDPKAGKGKVKPAAPPEEKDDVEPAAPSVDAPRQDMPLPNELLDVLRESVREVLRENEAESVAMTTRRNLEATTAEKTQRQKHAAGGAHGADSDRHVISAMKSEQLIKSFSFDNFFVGPNNAFSYKLCQAVAGKPGADYNPFFLYGDVGLGKTHLVNAIGNAILEKDSGQRVAYVSSSRFATRMAEAMHDHAMDVFRDNYCHWDVLILDDIQFLGGRIEAQEEFFHIFNVLQQEERQVIIAGDKAPDHLGLLEQRLVSRFSGGIVASLRPPNWETRVAILRRQVEQGDVPLNEDVLSMIASRVPNDVRKMIGALRKIVAHAQLVEEEISCEIANDILSHLGFEEAA